MSISAEEDAAVRRVFEPGSEWSGPEAVVETLSGGAAHKNYLVRLAGQKRVVKIWNGYWEAMNVLPPADVILSNTLCASRIGVGATVTSCLPGVLRHRVGVPPRHPAIPRR